MSKSRFPEYFRQTPSDNQVNFFIFINGYIFRCLCIFVTFPVQWKIVGKAVIRNLPDKAWALVISQSAIWTFNSDEYWDRSYTVSMWTDLVHAIKGILIDVVICRLWIQVGNHSFVSRGKIFTSWTPWSIKFYKPIAL